MILMRELDTSSQFRRDLKKALKQGKDVQKLARIIALLQQDKPLPAKYKEHQLTGNWKGYLECHIEPDWLLIYKPVGNDVLRLARVGSHSQLFKK